MKKIFVTVAEFLENGGVLEIGRKVLTGNGRFLGTYITEFKYKEQQYITYDRSHMKFTEGFEVTHLCFVEIECTPIYK